MGWGVYDLADMPEQQPETLEQPSPLSSHVVTWLWVGVSAFLAAGLLWQLYNYLHMPTRTSTWESAPASLCWKVRAGLPVYTDWRTGPVNLAIYGPVYYGLIGAIGRILDVDRLGLIAVGRWVGIVSICMALACGWRIASRVTSRAASAAVMFSAGLLSPLTVQFIASTRPDAPAAALSMMALCWAVRGTGWSLWGAVLMSLIAALTKPTALSAIISIVLLLLWAKRYGHAFLAAGGFVVAAVIAGVVMQAVTGGLFLDHLLVSRLAPMSWSYVWELAAVRWEPVAVAAIGLVSMIVLQRMGAYRAGSAISTPVRMMSLYFAITLLLAILTARRQGSNLNYLLESTLAAGVLFALMLGGGIRNRAAPWRRLWQVVSYAALFSPALLYMPWQCGVASEALKIARFSNVYNDEALQGIRSQDRPLLCLDPWLSYVAGVEGYLADPVAYGSMVAVRPEVDPVADRVSRRHFKVVVTMCPLEASDRSIHQDIPRIPPTLARQVAEHYDFAGRLQSWYLYRSKE